MLSYAGQLGSSELEFFRHRIHLERDSVRRAKDFLRTQRSTFQSRQRELKQRQLDGSTTARNMLDQLYQVLFMEDYYFILFLDNCVMYTSQLLTSDSRLRSLNKMNENKDYSYHQNKHENINKIK